MIDYQNIGSRWLDKIKNIPKKWWIVLGVLAIFLVALSEWIPSSDAASATSDADMQMYVEQLEQRLTDMVESIDGAGKCRVMVTLENGVEYVYANEQSTTSDRMEDHSEHSDKTTIRDDSESSYVIVNATDGRQGLLVTEIQPTVRGVVIVCEGGENEQIKERIMDTVATVLNITSSRVCVTKMS